MVQYIDKHLTKLDTVVSGKADGPDKVAAFHARKNGILVVEHEPEYHLHDPRYAPLVRNTKIAMDCDRMVAFWDGKSNGTLDAIKKAVLYGKEVLIIP